MSPDAEASDWVEREILLARQEQKAILPLRLRGRGLSLLIDQQYVDVSGGQMPPETFYARLRQDVGRAASGPPAAPPPVSQPVTPAPEPDLPPPAVPVLNVSQKMALVRALLDCEAMADRQSRATIVADLPPGIRFNIQRSDRDREDVSRIVTAALNYPDGLARLLEIVLFFEEDSYGMRAVNQLLVAWGMETLSAHPATSGSGAAPTTTPPSATTPKAPPPGEAPVVVVTPPPAAAWRPPTTPIAFDWVEIPAGEFIMGSDPKQDSLAYDNEQPQHRENVATFWIARVPVTVAQFAAFVEATGYQTTAEKEGSSRAFTGSKWEDVKGASWRAPRGPKSDVTNKQNHPVTCISWLDATAFCRWARVRLPNEAEWEKAARGTDGRLYPWGNNGPDKGLCNFNMNFGDTTPVGSFPAGKCPFGLLDMSGNIWEWTQTKWRNNYTAPADDSVQGDTARVVRGGSFLNDEGGVRCAARRFNNLPNDRGGSCGLRVVVSPIHP